MDQAMSQACDTAFLHKKSAVFFMYSELNLSADSVII